MSVTLDLAPPVARITLERPEKLNALTVEMLETLAAACDRIEADRAIRVAILTGSGRAFCVGADILAWSELPPLDMWREWTTRGHRVFDRLARLRVPLIAALNGHAIGGGLELAACADLRIAAPGAKFGLPEASIATVPGWAGTQRLVRRVGPRAVRRLALTGELVDAANALDLGLVDEVAEGALARAEALAATIAGRAPVSVQLVKQLINAAEGEEAANVMEQMAGAVAAFTQDAREGIASFRERRAADFKGE